MKKQLIVFFLLVFSNGYSQIKGEFKSLAGQELQLLGYTNFKSEILSVTRVDNLGNFTFIYPNTYKGLAVIKAKDRSSLAFILTENGLKIKGTNLKEQDSIRFTNSIENTLFIQYSENYKSRQNALSAWSYLKDKYEKDAIFKKQKTILKSIDNELIRLEKENDNSLNTIDKNTYISWFLPLKKLAINMPIVAKYKKEQIPELIKQFRTIDFGDPKIKTSGLLKNLIEGHYLLLENMEAPIDYIYSEMNKSSDYLIDNLTDQEALLNETGDFLFNFFEKRSLTQASEYVAIKLLSQHGCNLNNSLEYKLNSYQKLKTGNTAPDILFSDKTKLSDLKTTKLLVFGASWCPKCQQDFSLLEKYHTPWKQKNLEIIYISLDSNKKDFEKFYKNATWKTDCTYKGWDSKAVKEYHVFATPTYMILDANLKIQLRPISLEQVNDWVNSKN